jgi:hypothetical protein
VREEHGKVLVAEAKSQCLYITTRPLKSTPTA